MIHEFAGDDGENREMCGMRESDAGGGMGTWDPGVMQTKRWEATRGLARYPSNQPTTPGVFQHLASTG